MLLDFRDMFETIVPIYQLTDVKFTYVYSFLIMLEIQIQTPPTTELHDS